MCHRTQELNGWMIPERRNSDTAFQGTTIYQENPSLYFRIRPEYLKQFANMHNKYNGTNSWKCISEQVKYLINWNIEWINNMVFFWIFFPIFFPISKANLRHSVVKIGSIRAKKTPTKSGPAKIPVFSVSHQTQIPLQNNKWRAQSQIVSVIVSSCVFREFGKEYINQLKLSQEIKHKL